VTPSDSKLLGFFCVKSSSFNFPGLDEPDPAPPFEAGTTPADVPDVVGTAADRAPSDPFSAKGSSLIGTEVELMYLRRSEEESEVEVAGKE